MDQMTGTPSTYSLTVACVPCPAPGWMSMLLTWGSQAAEVAYQDREAYYLQAHTLMLPKPEAQTAPLIPQSSIKFIPVTVHTLQTLAAPTSGPTFLMLPHSSLLPAEANNGLPQMTGHSTLFLNTTLKWITRDQQSTVVRNCIEPLCLVISGEFVFFRPQLHAHTVSPDKG